MTTVTAMTGSELILVDSSGWLEYLTDDEKATAFAPYIEAADPVLVPTIVIFEVYRKLRTDRGKTEADRFYSQALQRILIPLDERLAAAAAAMEHRLSMADAIIYATARAHDAQLITSDNHFEGLPGVTLL
jgi:predicted nucleic acid-binding protein